MFIKLFSEFFEVLFSRKTKEKQQEAEDLALKAEAIVRQLSSLPPVSLNREHRDIISVLKSTCLQLERFQKSPELLPDNHSNKPSVAIKQEKIEEPAKNPSLIIEREAEPSVAAKEIIKLRDWILLAQSDGDTLSPKVLEAIYKQLEQILDKEGVKPLEENGQFNYERHKVVSTQNTDDPDKDDWVCSTVRPGYLFNDKLVRPQEVIVYNYQN